MKWYSLSQKTFKWNELKETNNFTQTNNFTHRCLQIVKPRQGILFKELQLVGKLCAREIHHLNFFGFLWMCEKCSMRAYSTWSVPFSIQKLNQLCPNSQYAKYCTQFSQFKQKMFTVCHKWNLWWNDYMIKV